MTLALLGGEPVIKNKLTPFNTIGEEEIDAAQEVLEDFPLSGFLGGQNLRGFWVQQLEREWAKAMGVKHAIACNSATSGLLAACEAVNIINGSRVLTTPFTMSATSAAPLMLGADLIYGDIDPETFNLMLPDAKTLDNLHLHAVIVTNLFGHPADLFRWRDACSKRGIYLIEDSAQTPFAHIGQTGQIYAGTVGDVGVFSFNVHKHLQCGEGGMVVSDDDELAGKVRNCINHGELAGVHRVGLNLRMGEVSAAIALEQFKKRDVIIGNRQTQADTLTVIAKDFDWIGPPVQRQDCEHVYYTWAAKFTLPFVPRDLLLKAIRAEGFPISTGYVEPLYRLPAFAHFRSPCPVAEAMHDRVLGCFENCAWTLSGDDFVHFEGILKKIERNMSALRGIMEAVA